MIRRLLLVIAAALALAGCPQSRSGGHLRSGKPAKKSRKHAHAKHEHPHLHPHGSSPHHHHPHPHPHLEGQDGHHHPY